ncbi:early light-induced protein 1, chloroplastic-like [Cryptomeria japonica]|uniref:early light-induced protein 1, chloroplastic-like n=1 Tax=Cryptomeria japonica TaxID=3369 RepID=UPI0027DA69DD|nr:early light-induced protein 1, chloroplastic-like [Cryptomeria japonica]
MAAMASMMMKAPGAVNCGAVKTNSVALANAFYFATWIRIQRKRPLLKAFLLQALPKVSTKFGDLFVFSGPAPEIINGRAAMLGFVSAIAVEVASGRDLLSQLNSGGLSWFALTAGLMTVGTLVPLFNGISRESTSQPIFSSTAEMWNGRFAMLGLLALAFTEYVKGGPLV